MPQIHVSDETFHRLSERAASLHISIDELVGRALEEASEHDAAVHESPLPLTGEALRAEIEAWEGRAAALAKRLPPGFVLDDSRETMYREREDRQL